MSDEATSKKPFVPPRRFVTTAWRAHRLIYRASDGRRVLRRPADGRAGLLRLRAVGRRSGEERAVILAYWQDGPRLVTLAMNGWGDPAPQWWLNLRARPDAEVDTADGVVAVRAREAEGAERERLWAGFDAWSGWGEGIDRHAALRSHATPVVVLEPRNHDGGERHSSMLSSGRA